MGKPGGRLWIVWSILAIGCAAVIGQLIDPTLVPVKELPPGWEDQLDPLSDDPPSGMLGAAGAGLPRVDERCLTPYPSS